MTQRSRRKAKQGAQRQRRSPSSAVSFRLEWLLLQRELGQPEETQINLPYRDQVVGFLLSISHTLPQVPGTLSLSVEAAYDGSHIPGEECDHLMAMLERDLPRLVLAGVSRSETVIWRDQPEVGRIDIRVTFSPDLSFLFQPITDRSEGSKLLGVLVQLPEWSVTPELSNPATASLANQLKALVQQSLANLEGSVRTQALEASLTTLHVRTWNLEGEGLWEEKLKELQEFLLKGLPQTIQSQRPLIRILPHRRGYGVLALTPIRSYITVGEAAPKSDMPIVGGPPIQEDILQPPHQRLDQDRQDLRSIATDEIARGRAAVEDRQAAVVERFQEWLDSLVGRRGESAEENKQISSAVYDAARNAGIQLIYNGKPAYLYWAKGVFEMRSTDKSRTPLGPSCATFPQLTARARHLAKELETTPSSPAAGGWADSVQETLRGRQPG